MKVWGHNQAADLVRSAPARSWYPGHRVRDMVRNAVTEKTGHEEAPDRSPPFGQHMPDGDYSLLRAKILAKLDDEDIRDALAGLNARPL